MSKESKRIEFGDFQTPFALATEVCKLLSEVGVQPASILEPTCGTGAFVKSASECFPNADKLVGLEINRDYLNQAKLALQSDSRIELSESDFFSADWSQILNTLPEPIAVIGNLPWVTNSGLGVLDSENLPVKSNFKHHRGLDAITGKGNFDISEWMLIRLLLEMRGKNGYVAMLCKTAVARKVLSHAWKQSLPISNAKIFKIDAMHHFDVAVDACLFYFEMSALAVEKICRIYSSLTLEAEQQELGFSDNVLVANIGLFRATKHLFGLSPYDWRSGVKHDCARVMELYLDQDGLKNGLDELVDVESEFVFPLLKSSDLANGRLEISRWMIVTQRRPNEDTALLKVRAPKLWNYLNSHIEDFAMRRSSIYNNRPPFSMFGIGDYTFSPWKVAVSGLYKKLSFHVVGPSGEMPVVLDDTCYFLSFDSQLEAETVSTLLNSAKAREFFDAHVFWDMKRPITLDILKRLDLRPLARHYDVELVIGTRDANYANQESLIL